MRTTDQAVRDVLETNPDYKVAGHIRTASVLVDAVQSHDTGGLLTTGLLREIETYLAAHFAALKDPQLQSGSTGSASGQYQGQTGMGLDLTWWGQQAKMLDLTGYLAELDKRNKEPQPRLGMMWLGTQEGRGNFRGAQDSP